MPETLGKYELRALLGRGGMGTVHEAWDPVIARRVALKTVPRGDVADEEARDQLLRFQREAQAAGRLHHPAIVGVFDYGETDELAYIVMEFVDGRTLKAVLDAGERFPLPEIVRLMGEVLAGLHYSHERGVVHRDIKPANIILTADGHAKIADFGIARLESSELTQAGTVMGTAAYMSPEQFMGQPVDARTDLYACGVLLYLLLTGERPFEGSMSAIMHKVLHTQPVQPSALAVGLPAALDAVVARAMARSPGERHPTAAAFADALRQAAAAPVPDDEHTMLAPGLRPQPSRPPAGLVKPDAPPRSRRGALLGGVAAAVLLVVSAGAWFALAPHTPPARIADATPPAIPVPARPVAANAAPAVAPEPAEGTAPAPASQATPGVAPAVATPFSAIPVPSSAAPATPTPAPPPPAPASSPPVPEPTRQAALQRTPGELRRAVAEALAPLPCTLPAGSAPAADRLVLDGLVGAGAPEARLHQAVTDAAPGVAVDWHARAFDGPYCDALDTIRPAMAAFDAGSGLHIALTEGRTSLVADAFIVVQAALPGFPAWLQVDYLTHDGSLQHMHPVASDAARLYPARSTQRIGEPHPGFAGWQVGPPYGTDMIVAVASAAPLFEQPRPDDEGAADYLRALKAAIEAAQRRHVQVSATAILVGTREK